MAEAESSEPHQPNLGNEDDEGLKYLGFVREATFHALMCATKFYSYAKENSGPLKPGVDTVEGTLKEVVSPVYHKFHDVPIDVLKFVDRKVEQSMNKVQTHVSPTLKQVSTRALEKAQKAPGTARSVMLEVKSSAVVETVSELAKTVYDKCEPAAKDLYAKYEPVAEQYARESLHQFPVLAQTVGPTAAFCSEKYNQTVQYAAENGSMVASHLPRMPTDKIVKAFSPPKIKKLE